LISERSLTIKSKLERFSHFISGNMENMIDKFD